MIESLQSFLPLSINPLNPLSFNPQSLKGRGLPLPLSLPGESDNHCQNHLWSPFASKVRFKTVPKEHLKINTSKIINKWSNGLTKYSKLHQKLSPWEVKKEPGTKIVIKSADLNYNNYLLHFSHVCKLGNYLFDENWHQQSSKIDAWRMTQTNTSKSNTFLRRVPKN